MRNHFAFMLLAGVTTNSFAQLIYNDPKQSMPSPNEHVSRLKEESDRFTGATKFSTPFTPQMNMLKPQVVATVSSGKPHIITLLLTGGFEHWRYLKCNDTHWLLDGRPAEFPPAKHIGEVLGAGFVVEGVGYENLPLEKLTAIANAKLVEFKVCNDEYKFDSATLQDFEELAIKHSQHVALKNFSGCDGVHYCHAVRGSGRLTQALGLMKPFPSTLPILFVKNVTSDEFVEFWASEYPLKNEPSYQENIGKPLTAARVWALFEWKNNGPIARHKRDSIQKNYIDATPVVPRTADRDGLIKFIREPGGAIWRIFWLHCYDPAKYPIFDQHVYRAMRYLLDGKAEEPPTTNSGKATAYADEYLPFHKGFKHSNGKLLDQALWSFGKHLKGRNAV